ncbi:MAG: DUF1150 family protein [Rhodospirillales bacterium]|jgi:hypothetical protein
MNPTTFALRQLTPQAFAALGIEALAYVRKVELDGQPGFSIHAADGTVLTVVSDKAIAFATVRQHDLEPMSVH